MWKKHRKAFFVGLALSLVVLVTVAGALTAYATQVGFWSSPKVIPPTPRQPFFDPRQIEGPLPTNTPATQEEADRHKTAEGIIPAPTLTGETIDLAPNLAREDKGTIIIQLPDGRFQFLLIDPRVPLDKIPIPQEGKIYTIWSPPRMEGQHPPPPPSSPIVK